MKKIKRVKVSVRPSACFDDARIVEVSSPDGLAFVAVHVGHMNGRLQVLLSRSRGPVDVRGPTGPLITLPDPGGVVP